MRRMDKKREQLEQTSKLVLLTSLLGMVALVAGLVLLIESLSGQSLEHLRAAPGQQIVTEQPQKVRIMASGDLLYHDLLYMGARKEDGSYDFEENYQYVKPWLEKADLALGDFEGTIYPDGYLAGYPLFNAPEEVTKAIKDAGYDVLDLAHNHILDSGLAGLQSTVAAFDKQGLATVGVYAKQERQKAPLLIKEIKGIKIAILAYAYGFNGLEETLSQEDYDHYLSDMNEDKIKAELERAEKEADITLVMPQMGIEYQLEPTDDQISLYHKMIDWGADVIFGGHPHVVEPAEVVTKDGQQKLIIYSMGNFLSNQRIETMEGVDNASWTERGVLMDVTIEKLGSKTVIQSAQAHPTWVNRTEKGYLTEEGFPAYLYQTYVLEDFIEGGLHRERLSLDLQERVDQAYSQMREHVGLEWPHSKKISSQRSGN